MVVVKKYNALLALEKECFLHWGGLHYGVEAMNGWASELAPDWHPRNLRMITSDYNPGMPQQPPGPPPGMGMSKPPGMPSTVPPGSAAASAAAAPSSRKRLRGASSLGGPTGPDGQAYDDPGHLARFEQYRLRMNKFEEFNSTTAELFREQYAGLRAEAGALWDAGVSNPAWSDPRTEELLARLSMAGHALEEAFAHVQNAADAWLQLNSTASKDDFMNQQRQAALMSHNIVPIMLPATGPDMQPVLMPAYGRLFRGPQQAERMKDQIWDPAMRDPEP